MDAKAAQPFLEQLTRERETLLAQIAEQRGGKIGRAEQANAHFANTQDDSAQINSAKDLEFAMNEHEIAELLAIEEALQRIKEGVYGFCIDCGTSISTQRLQAAPQALRCISCQTKFEKTQTV